LEAALRKLDWEAVTLKKQAAAAAKKLLTPAVEPSTSSAFAASTTPSSKSKGGERPHPSVPPLLEAHAAALVNFLGPAKVLIRSKFVSSFWHLQI
jgi:hypothetical protein